MNAVYCVAVLLTLRRLTSMKPRFLSTLATITASRSLPADTDESVTLPLYGHGWLRRVPGTAYGVFYVVSDEMVTVVAIGIAEDD